MGRLDLAEHVFQLSRLGRVRKPPEIYQNGHVNDHRSLLVANLAAERVEPLGEARVLREHEGAELLDLVLPREPVQDAEEEPAESPPLVVIHDRHGDLGDVRLTGQPREPAYPDAERRLR